MAEPSSEEEWKDEKPAAKKARYQGSSPAKLASATQTSRPFDNGASIPAGFAGGHAASKINAHLSSGGVDFANDLRAFVQTALNENRYCSGLLSISERLSDCAEFSMQLCHAEAGRIAGPQGADSGVLRELD